MDAIEILKLESKCIQEEPVYCSSACPVQVDVRSMLGHIQKVNFKDALKIYRKKVIFPDIISRICDEPCKDACIRKRLDEPLSIRLLEKSCADFRGVKEKNTTFNIVRKNKHIAIIGGGMSGLV